MPWCAAAGLVSIVISEVLLPRWEGRGLDLTVLAPNGTLLHREGVAAIDLESVLSRPDLPSRFVTLRWSGFWFLEAGCICSVQLRAGAASSVAVDGEVLAERDEDQKTNRVRARAPLQPGPHAIVVEYRQRTDPPLLRLSSGTGDDDLRPVDSLFRTPHGRGVVAAARLRLALRILAGTLLVPVLIVAAAGVARAAEAPPSSVRLSRLVLAGVLVAAGALRLEYLIERTWTGAPPLAVAFARSVSGLHPAWAVERPEEPFSGDPFEYIRLGRKMVHFYDAHVREPLFIFATRIFLWLLSGRDIAVAFASATFSVLLVLATYLLGSRTLSRGVGLLAALALALDFRAIALSAEGWRDDCFAFFVVLSAYAFLRLMQEPSLPSALVAGLAAGGACLTRITALSFVVPAFLYLWVFGSPPRKRGGEFLGLAAFLCLLVLAPYLLSCAIAFGDPFYSINAHTVFYRSAERLPHSAPMDVLTYLFGRGHPWRTLDTAVRGVTTVPFEQDFTGFDYLSLRLGPVLATLALVGLGALVWSAEGRLLLLVLVTSLFPFAFTWNIVGGEGWRFRYHAYSFYLVASGLVLASLASLVSGRDRWASSRRLLGGLTLALVAGVPFGWSLGWLSYRALREDIAHGGATFSVASPVGRFVVRSGFYPPTEEGNEEVRYARREASLLLPLEESTAYLLRLRMDPFLPSPAAIQTIDIGLNGGSLGEITLAPPGARVGSYEVSLPSSLVRSGRNTLSFRSRFATRVGSVPYEGKAQRGWEVAFRLWTVSLQRQ